MVKTTANRRRISRETSPRKTASNGGAGQTGPGATFLKRALDLLKADPKTYLIYIHLYIPTGFFMNAMGQYFHIGQYAYWWQVFTCYGLYLIPASLLVRERSYFDQYLSGLLIIAILELPAYSFGTSIAYPGSILDHYLTPRNYTLFMTVFFAGFIPLGNWAVGSIRRQLEK